MMGDPNQPLLPGGAILYQVKENKQEHKATPGRKKSSTGTKILWLDPKILEDHPANIELFGENRLNDVDDLIMSLETGFDENRPIKAVRRGDGSSVIIDGHRRQRAAIQLAQNPVPVIYAAFADEMEERLEMLTANLVRNRKYRSVGLGTAVDLVQLLHPREVRRGRPPKENQAPGAAISSDTKRDYYAGLLGISVKKFRMADYILRHGTKEEKLELDMGPRSTTAIYRDVHARVKGEDLTPMVDPKELARMAGGAVRAVVQLLKATDESVPFKSAEIEADIESLLNRARLETGGEVESGTTANEAIRLLRGNLRSGGSASNSLPFKLTV